MKVWIVTTKVSDEWDTYDVYVGVAADALSALALIHEDAGTSKHDHRLDLNIDEDGVNGFVQEYTTHVRHDGSEVEFEDDRWDIREIELLHG